MATLAPALATLRAQVNATFPNRNTASDGWIASEAHLDRTGAGAAASQHNPNEHDIVCAVDITEDLSVGLDCNRLMEELDASNDPRIFYLIHDRQIDNSNDSRTPYNGSNPHVTHLHVSTKFRQPELYNDTRPWALPMLGGAPPPPPPPPAPAPGRPTIAEGARGPHVWDLQRTLTRNYPLYNKYTPTGYFGDLTDRGVREFQRRSRLGVDGIVGPITWRALGLWHG